MEERWNLQIAKAVYELREKAGISPEELARRSRVPVSTLRRLEDADARWVSVSQLLRVAHALGGRLTVEKCRDT